MSLPRPVGKGVIGVNPQKRNLIFFESTFCRLEYVFGCNLSNSSLYYVMLILI